MPQNTPNRAPNQHMIRPHVMGQFRPPNKGRIGPPRSATANAAGTTTTLLCPDADATDLAVGDKVRLYTSAHVIKDNKLFTITVESSAAGTTTFTFSPAASAATASGDYISNAQDISDIGDSRNFVDIASIDTRLNAIDGTKFTQSFLNTMTLNDKLYALKLADESEFG